MDRKQATESILEAKATRGATFAEIGEKVGRDKVWVTAALFGQQTMSADEAKAVTEFLDLDDGVCRALQEIPMRGTLDSPVPVDPTIYRFYEIIQVYGTTIKALVHEMCGDGIVSAIDFKMDIQKKPDPAGDRVVITLDADFHALLAHSGALSPSVLRLRVEGLGGREIASLIRTILGACSADLASGAVATADTTRLRLRRLPLIR